MADHARFGRMVERAMRERGWGYGRLGAYISDPPPGATYDATQMKRVCTGRVRSLDRELVRRLISVLDLDAADAWEAAGLWPDGFGADDYRDFVLAGGTSASALAVQDMGTKRNRYPRALRLVHAA